MITPIDKLPGSPTDKNKALQIEMMRDVLTIIEQRIHLAEITANYSDHYMRSAIKTAIRRAVWRWNSRNVRKVDYAAFEIHRRKDADGAGHWYIEFKGGEAE